MAQKQEMTFAPFGEHGIETAVDETHVWFRIPRDRAKATPSKSGKMVLSGNSGSFQTVPGADGFKANISAGYASGK
ncbi:MAG TPA: hypothetical protein VIY48_06070 [Candidatus Paceibacterota bacterium]